MAGIVLGFTLAMWAQPTEHRRTAAVHETCQPSTAFLGVLFESHADGAKVVRTYPHTAAFAAGIRPGDVIVKVDNTELTPGVRLKSAIQTREPGDSVQVLFKRQSRTQSSVLFRVADVQLGALDVGCRR